MTDTLKLRAKIIEHGYTQKMISKYLDLSLSAINAKINNQTDFRASEIYKLIHLLDIHGDAIESLFFTEKVSFLDTRISSEEDS